MDDDKPNLPDVKFYRSETLLFERLAYDVSIQNTSVSTYHPLHSVENKTSPIIFTITGNDINYINLGESKLYVRCKLVDKSGKNIPYEVDKTKASYAPVNNFLHSLFSSVTVHVNDVEITPQSGYYPYRSYIETLLAKGKDYKKSQGQSSCYYKTKDEKDIADPGWVSRMNLADKSNVFEMYGRPHLDLFHQTKYLPPGVDVKITFHRSNDEFAIHATGGAIAQNLQIQIEEAQLFVTKHTIHSDIMMRSLRNWQKGYPAKYPMRKIEMKPYTLPVGTLSNYNENLITGFLPDRIVIGLVNSRNVHGTYASNPLVFEHFGLQHISVTCNSEVITNYAMDVDFDNDRALRAYASVFEGLGLADCDSGVDLTLEEYKSSKTFFVYDLRHLRNAFCPPRHGNCVINLKFKTALTEVLTVMCYLEYQSVLHINSDRNVFFKDFSK